MYCARMMARGLRVGLAIDCTSLDIEDFEPLPPPPTTTTTTTTMTTTTKAGGGGGADGRVRYFHDPAEWDDYDVEYHRMPPPPPTEGGGGDGGPLAPRALPEFCRVVDEYLRRNRAPPPSSSSSSAASAIAHVALFDSRGGLGAASYLAGGYMCRSMRSTVRAALECLREGTPRQSGSDAGVRWGLRDARLARDLRRRFGAGGGRGGDGDRRSQARVVVRGGGGGG